jgi:K+ transporter
LERPAHLPRGTTFIVTADTPRAGEEERATITPVSKNFSRLALKFGYMETPNVPKALAIARKRGWPFDIMSTSFFPSPRALKPSAQSGMPTRQDRLFIGLAKSASSPRALRAPSTSSGSLTGRGRGGELRSRCQVTV